ncbi:MAG: DUF6628 family protein [Pseudomonadota bacterium]
MSDPSKLDTILPYAAPICGDTRTLLFAIRRMAIHGLHDAFAANAMLNAYGVNARKPLILLRAMLVDIARAARGNIIMSPCCAPRMTEHEHAILSALRDPESVETHLAAVLDGRKASIVPATILALTESFASMGRPIAL